MHIYLTATVKSKPGKSEALKEQLLKLVVSSKKEEACLQYDLHQSQSDPEFFIFHEEWESQTGLDLHNGQPHIADFIKVAPELVEGQVLIHKTHKIG